MTKNGANKPMISTLKGMGINMVALSLDMLYILQDGITIELWARKSRTLQVLSEQKINMEQLIL